MNSIRANLKLATILTMMLSLCAFATDTAAAAKLSLVAPAGPFMPGQSVQIVVMMSDLDGQMAAGFQAFLEFDPAELTFVSASYTSAPFGLPVISPIQAVAGSIDLASGINSLLGQSPTTSDSVLATLNFSSVSVGCRVDSVRFRVHEPPTRITMLGGAPIQPLTLQDSLGISCPADIYPSTSGDGVVNVQDLLVVIGAWGPCPPIPTCCSGDIVQDSVVNVVDLLALLASWGSCP